MDRLQQLVTLKRAATNIDALDRYVAAAYCCAALWAPGAPAGVTVLVLDGIVDAAAHDDPFTPENGWHPQAEVRAAYGMPPARPSEGPQSDESATEANLDTPTPHTGTYGPERIRETRTA